MQGFSRAQGSLSSPHLLSAGVADCMGAGDQNSGTYRQPWVLLLASAFATGSHCVAQSGLGVKVLLSLPPEFEVIGMY